MKRMDVSPVIQNKVKNEIKENLENFCEKDKINSKPNKDYY